MLYIITIAFYFARLTVVEGKCYLGAVCWAPNMYQHAYSAVIPFLILVHVSYNLAGNALQLCNCYDNISSSMCGFIWAMNITIDCNIWSDACASRFGEPSK